jgi:uncharacterized protein YggE
MRRSLVIGLAVLAAAPGAVRGQVGGNIGFSQPGARARAEQAEQARRKLTREELPPNENCTFIEASVLMNVKADEFVAVFAVAREGETPAECARKVDETVKVFTDALKPLGVGADDVYADFIAQHKVFGYELAGEVAREKLVGYELSKNVSVHYKDSALIDKLTLAAARAQVFDLVKVDYVVKDRRAVEDRLAEAAADVVKRKAARYEKLLGIKTQPPGQVYADRSATYYPSGMYDSYTAFAAEEMSQPFDRQRYVVQSVRKPRTFFFNALDGSGFDEVINPVVVEPVVQFTLYLKVKYAVEQARAR